jgi:hypothetical protein
MMKSDSLAYDRAAYTASIALLQLLHAFTRISRGRPQKYSHGLLRRTVFPAIVTLSSGIAIQNLPDLLDFDHPA